MLISMVRSKNVSKKKDCSKKSSEMIWKMPERISIKKYPKMKRKNIIMINLLISMHE